MDPRQSTTVPKVSKSSAFGMTDTLADRGFGRPATITPALKPIKSSLRFIVARIIYNAIVQGEAQCECVRFFGVVFLSSWCLFPPVRRVVIVGFLAFRC